MKKVIKFVSIRVESDLWLAFREYCLRNNLSMQDFLKNKIKESIDSEVKRRPRRKHGED